MSTTNTQPFCLIPALQRPSSLDVGCCAAPCCEYLYITLRLQRSPPVPASGRRQYPAGLGSVPSPRFCLTLHPPPPSNASSIRESHARWPPSPRIPAAHRKPRSSPNRPPPPPRTHVFQQPRSIARLITRHTHLRQDALAIILVFSPFPSIFTALSTPNISRMPRLTAFLHSQRPPHILLLFIFPHRSWTHQLLLSLTSNFPIVSTCFFSVVLRAFDPQ